MGRCSVLKCKSDSERKIPDISFHSFPDDVFLRKKWIEATRKTNWTPKKSSKICSKHFAQNMLIKKKKMTFLLPNAVPLLEMKTSMPSTSSSVSSCDIEMGDLITQVDSKTKISMPSTSKDSLHDIITRTVVDLKIKTSNLRASSCVNMEEENMESNVDLCSEVDSEEEQPPAKKIKKLQPDDGNLAKKTKSLEYSPRTLRKMLKRSEKQSEERQKKLKALREKCRRLTKKAANLENVIAELKAKSFVTEEEGGLLQSIDQINEDFLKKFLNPKRSGRKFSPALRKFALCLNFISPRAYKYVRKQFNTCLPHPSTITAWYKSFDASPGFTAESLDCIKLLAERKDKKLYCALCMDEMAIRKHVHWDGEKCIGLVNYGEVLDGHNVVEAREALVFMVTCINDGWKIPVGYFLINGCNGEQKANLVTQCINLLTGCNIIVTSLTFDGCPSNFSMAKSLGCTIDSPENIIPFFTINGQEIVIVPDPAHMLKLVRNTLGQKKELLDAHGRNISWQYIEKLNELQEKEGIHLANRLKNQHVNFTKQIMKVKLAAQTFSNSVAIAIKFCDETMKLSEFSGSDATVDFITKINNLFDILNSRTLNAYGFKRPICEKNGKDIIEYLTEIETYIKGIKLMGKSVLETNRKIGFFGFLFFWLGIKSLKKMHNDLIVSNKLKFLPFYKLSQDYLECFFSSIRSKGGFNNNPTAFQFQSAFRRLVVHGEIKSIESGNCIPLEEIKILTHTDVRYEKKIDKCAHRDIVDDLNLDCQDDDDHDYLPDPCRLTIFTQEVITYIGGYVVKKIKKSISCEDCLLALVSIKYAGLIFQKDKGGLNYPSHDVVKICTMAEKTLRVDFSQKGITFFSQKNIKPRLILAVFKRCQTVFLTDHFNRQPFIGNHRILLIKAIIACYLELRIHHATKTFDPKEKIRNVHNKLVLFKGQ